MLKYLLLILLAGLVWWVWQKRAAPPAETRRPETAPERMVTCAHCGVHLPESDSLADGDRHYCCEAHRQARMASGPK